MRRALGLMLASAVLAGCNNGGGNGNPAGPSTTIVSITIDGSGFLSRGATQSFTATAMTSGGGTQPVTSGTWGSDAAGVVDITPGGQATAVSLGLATVFVDFQGVRGTLLIRVVPSFAGEYLGMYTVTACAATGDWVAVDACGDTFSIGSLLPLAFLFAQTGATLTGQTALGSIISPSFTATVRDDGGVTIDVVANFSGILFTETWELRADEPGSITGTIRVVISEPSLAGNTTLEGTITEALLTGAAAASWRDALSTPDGSPFETFRDAVRQRRR